MIIDVSITSFSHYHSEQLLSVVFPDDVDRNVLSECNQLWARDCEDEPPSAADPACIRFDNSAERSSGNHVSDGGQRVNHVR
jgi:hypothetical protein